jgi:1-aminocyclopropane-1-carboxylate deaminase/D-cysteine desulfhydrase-like pyridoxal-dependent ACC family enzyme
MSRDDCATALDTVDSWPRLSLLHGPTPIDEAKRLRARLNLRPRLLIKRDDAIAFGLGGNKVRKMELVGARALADGADTLVTTGGVQSNHCRVTAALAARFGLGCVLVVNGEAPAKPTGNALLVRQFGARVDYVAGREARAPRLQQVVEELRAAGGQPFAVPLGASTPLGALGYVRAVGELLQQIPAPDIIVHSSSSAGTQAGIVAGCALHGVKTRVLGISADDPAEALADAVRELIDGIADLLRIDRAVLTRDIEIDASLVGGGYGVPTPQSQDAIALAASCEGLPIDPVYGAKALAGLIAHARAGAFDGYETVLFWHTGGVPGIFA